MILHLTDFSSEPLHEQISRQVRAQILAGQLADGDALPSIRALARMDKGQRHHGAASIRRPAARRPAGLPARQGFFYSTDFAGSEANTALERLLKRLRVIVDEARAEGLDDAQIRRVVDQTIEEK